MYRNSIYKCYVHNTYIYITNYLTTHDIGVTSRTYLLTMDNIIYKSSYRDMEKDRGKPLNWVMYTIKNFIEG